MRPNHVISVSYIPLHPILMNTLLRVVLLIGTATTEVRFEQAGRLEIIHLDKNKLDTCNELDFRLQAKIPTRTTHEKLSTGRSTSITNKLS